MIEVVCIKVDNPKQISELLSYFGERSSLAAQRIPDAIGRKLLEEHKDHLYGKFREQKVPLTENSFIEQVPSKMLYQRDLFLKYS